MHRIASMALLGCLAMGAQGQVVAFTDFSMGTDGWAGNAGAVHTHNASTGNSYLRIPGTIDTFWFEFWNDSNRDWTGDYTSKGDDLLEFSLDFHVNRIVSSGGAVVTDRAVILEFRSFHFDHDFYHYASVYVELGRVSGYAMDWTRFSVTFDPNATELPAGWGAYGNEDDQGNWIMPDGATFADMLSNVGEVVIHSAEYGMYYPFSFYDVSIDNLTLTVVPAPASAALLGLGAMVARRRRR